MPETPPGGQDGTAVSTRINAKDLQGTLLAFDFGLKRIGVAVAETILGNARGLGVVNHSESGPDWSEIDDLLKDWQPVLLLVGYPCNMDGSPSEMSDRALEFAAELKKRSRIPVEPVDERLSSSEAMDQLRQQRRDGLRKRRINKELIDQEAARLLLQQWLTESAG